MLTDPSRNKSPTSEKHFYAIRIGSLSCVQYVFPMYIVECTN